MTEGLQRRVRVPRPLLPRRLASGRGATEQPNALGDGDARLDLNFWAMLILTGIATGLFGDAMMLILRVVQRVGYGYSVTTLAYSAGISFQAAVVRASGVRRIEALVVAGVIGGLAWYLLRQHTPGEKTDVEDEVWNGTGEISFRRSLGTSVISEIVVGLGASLGREAAPRLMGAASGSVLGRWRGLTTAQRRLLVACGAGAGLAAVYNVPLGGTLFTAEVLCGALTLPVVLPALTCATIATVTAWIYLPSHATYTGIPAYGIGPSDVAWALLAGPVIGLVAVGYVRLIGWVSARRPTGRISAVAPLIAFLILGVAALRYPQLLGNGKGIAHDAFLGIGGIGFLLALFVLKPLVTALCLGSGASGGLFTPTMSTGAVLGGGLGIAWSLAWPGGSPGAYAMIGAAAMLGAAMQAPLTGIVMILELTHSGLDLTLPLIAATLLATGVARYLDGYSIYSARLPAK
ncbi:MAG TPA: chloride channel protein [Candidatus Dormibacteraeota bacterium]|jgi:H+/Cl- antiporter ClcA|nr:chloride channel protein [Candidatus Dormibacteraeota bacterium]